MSHRLLMKDILQTGVLEGPLGQMAFTCSLPLLASRQYAVVGKLVQWSVQHGGPGLPVLSQALFDLMVGRSPALEGVTVPDIAVANILTQVCII